MAYITCKNAAFAYEGKIVIDELNFVVHAGDYLCIVGENGSGKRTVGKGLLRLKTPARGAVEFGDGLKSQEIGYLPQQTDVQRDFPASVYEVVLSGCLNRLGRRPFYGAAEKKEALMRMEQLNILDMRRQCYRELSGGQQQRVLLARALCATQKLLLLDEPVAGLDPIVTGELYQMISKINRELHVTIVMVSHDLEGAVGQASHILHLKNKQIFFGTKDQYVHSPIGRAFLGGEEHV